MLLAGVTTTWAVTPKKKDLLVLHNATQGSMNAIASSEEGSLIFNTSDQETYERNITQWQRILGDGSETKVVAGECTKVTGKGTVGNPYVVSSYIPAKTQATAELTCKAILDLGCPVPSGTYWINPDGGSTSNAFQVHCDMVMFGGGWTEIAYKKDLPLKNRWKIGDRWRWLPSNFSLVLTDAQINAIRSHSTEGKQEYFGTCRGVVQYRDGNGNYGYAFGYRFHTGDETVHGQADYPGTNFTISQDGCFTNGAATTYTVVLIKDKRVPIINVNSLDNGNAGEAYGAKLVGRLHSAWLR